LAQSCKDQGKQLSTQYYARPNISAQEVRNPNSVITETIGPYGEITSPRVYSPAAQFKKTQTILSVLMELVTAERVARRQYDELLMFPDLSKFVPDILYIRNDEHEHEEILLCMIKRLGSPAAAQPIMQPTSQQSVTLTPKALGEFYETILDRFGDEEEKSVNSYQELLVKVQSSTTALINARMQKNMSMESYQEAIVPLNELERKINKHLNEERVHLDVIDAMQEMFSNMKLGKVY
jgi:rubrerythrin